MSPSNNYHLTMYYHHQIIITTQLLSFHKLLWMKDVLEEDVVLLLIELEIKHGRRNLDNDYDDCITMMMMVNFCNDDDYGLLQWWWWWFFTIMMMIIQLEIEPGHGSHLEHLRTAVVGFCFCSGESPVEIHHSFQVLLVLCLSCF